MGLTLILNIAKMSSADFPHHRFEVASQDILEVGCSEFRGAWLKKTVVQVIGASSLFSVIDRR